MNSRYKKELLRFLIRFVGAVIYLSTLSFLFGHILVKMLLPFISCGIEYGDSKYEVLEVKVLTRDSIKQIHYTIRTHEAFIDQEGKIWPASDQTTGIQAYVVHIYPIIAFSFLLSWPYLTKKKKLPAALISILLLIMVAMIDVPVNLLYSLKESYNSGSLPYQAKIQWYHEFAYLFLNTGGRQFLALLVFVVSVVPFHFSGKNTRFFSGSRKT